MIDKRTFLYLALGVLGFLLWNQWQSEHTVATHDNKAKTVAEAKVEDGNLPPATIVANQHSKESTKPVTETVTNSTEQGKYITVSTDVLKLTIDTKGGNFVNASLPKYPESLDKPEVPVDILTKDPANFYTSQSGLMGDNGPDTSKGQVLYQPEKSEYSLAKDENVLTVDLPWHNAEGLSVIKRFTLKRGQYDVKVDYLINNASPKTWQGNFYAQIQHKKTEAGGMLGMNTYQGAAFSSEKIPYEKVTYKDMSKANYSRSIKGGWVSMQQQYFVSAWVPPANDQNHYFSRQQNDEIYTIGFVGPEITVAPGAKGETSALFYVGPEIQETLDKLAPHLGKTIDYGWLFFLSLPIYWLLALIESFVGNWGWAIVITTIIIKLAFYKLAESSYRSMAKMRDLQPRLVALKERYADDKQKQSQAMMELYKSEKVNPLGGCLPMLVQMPFFIALYYVLIESVELRQAPWILWIQDLSARDPLYILPAFMMAAMILQTRLSPAPPDRTQAIMMYIMPIAFGVFFATFPAGLVLYWFVNILFSIAQQWYIMRKYSNKKPAVGKKLNA